MSSTGSTGGGRTERCSACGRSGDQLEKLLDGRNERTQQVRICDHCVRESVRAIADAPTRIPGGALVCAYCAKPDEQVAVIIGVGVKLICDECVYAFRAAIEPTA